MKGSLKALLALVICIVASSPLLAQQENTRQSCLTTVSDIPLPGHSTRYDYQSIDPQRRLLFIAHLGDNAVTVFDLKTQTVLKNITNIPSPHGILAVPELGRAFVSATGADEIYAIDEQSLMTVGTVAAGHFPDGIAFDPRSERIFVSDEFGKTVTAIDAPGLRQVGKIEIGGTVGNTHYDPTSRMILTADESSDELLEIDPATLHITERIKLPGCRGAHGFVVGQKPHFAYVTGEDNASLVAVDLTARDVIQKFSVGRGPDVLAIDKGLGILYVASESGVVSVFKISDRGLSGMCEGRLWAHAHTVCVDQVTHRVFFPLQSVRGIPILRIVLPSVP